MRSHAPPWARGVSGRNLLRPWPSVPEAGAIDAEHDESHRGTPPPKPMPLPTSNEEETMRGSPAAALALVGVASIAFATDAPPPAARHASLPAASPDGKHVAFCSNRDGGAWELYVVDVDGRGLRRLTHSPEEELVPGWADGGGSVVYMTVEGDTARLHSLPLEGGAARTLLALDAKGIKLSNDGRRVGYAVGSWTRNRLVVANADGSEARAITDSSASYFNLAWSPDDGRIAATRSDSAGLQVWIMAPDGSEARAVTRSAKSDGSPQWPAWSPDGRQLAFQSGTYDRKDPAKSTAHIWIIDLATGEATKLAPHARPFLDETPSWLADGKRIVFQSTRAGPFDLWIMRADGGAARRLTR